MISRKTVLILGAGASAPYSYPTGVSLKNEILNNCQNPQSRDQILAVLGCTYEFVDEFCDAFRLSGQATIDEFLEYRSEYTEIGKLVITQVLIQHEDINTLFANNDWYSDLGKALRTSFEDFDKNKLSIITFNYDRSLEAFLFSSLKKTHNKSDIETYEKIKAIPILHIHGQVGLLPWQSQDSGAATRKYEKSVTDDSLKKSSQSIRIIHEAEEEGDVVLKKAHLELIQAERIIFLGFGYHKANLDRLKLSNIKLGPDNIVGTAKGLSKLQQKTIEKSLNSNLRLRNDGADEFRDIKDFFKEIVIL